MSWFDHFDLTKGDLPPWLNQFVAITRPLGTSMLIAIPALGAFTIGVVSGFSERAGAAMAKNAVAFLQGIPDAAYAMITAAALGYTAGKSWEAIKAPAPTGGQDPEGATPAPKPTSSAPPARRAPPPPDGDVDHIIDLSQE